MQNRLQATFYLWKLFVGKHRTTSI